jgi:hypothetical protein
LAFFVVVIEMIVLLWKSPTYFNKISDLSYTCTRLKFQVSTAPLMQWQIDECKKTRPSAYIRPRTEERKKKERFRNDVDRFYSDDLPILYIVTG